MKIEELKSVLGFDNVDITLNPYYLNNEFEDKGSVILIKEKTDSPLKLSDISDLCFQCPDLVNHEDLVLMVIINFNKDYIITSYTIAGTKYKINSNDLKKYENLIGEKIERT
ncbi:hypothetical protein CI105_03970 [Candidatus Izimaplasma bacterium ZiA1]|uniref:hypothetical protein n=1 Tax=Candidatus Izimoplasma sp. ZiA1 TaxID=2024899 RepID=UPI000BAA472B|nr:hypothetical protein CI105_03970 [Candidatus Izimaplasma bacterium ZiA1]